MMKEKPILFSAPMVRAIMEGRKTQTRRVVSVSNATVNGYPAKTMWPHLSLEFAELRQKSSLAVVLFGKKAPADVHLSAPWIEDDTWHRVRCKYEPGDVLWVRETFVSDGDYIDYRADDKTECGVIWKPSIFMPRWASRIMLEIESVRVERVQEISYADCKAEGLSEPREFNMFGADAEQRRKLFGYSYQKLWDSLNAKRGFSWESNPWVWVITFKRIEGSAR